MALFAWASVQRFRSGVVADHLVHVPNGGRRNVPEALRLKRMGVQKGFPDYVLFVAINGWHGLAVEMKRPALPGVERGRVQASQSDWLVRLAAQGYRSEVAYGWQEAARIISDYLGLRSCSSRT